MAGGEWREGLGEVKGGMGNGGEKGEVRGITPWLLGDRRPCVQLPTANRLPIRSLLM